MRLCGIQRVHDSAQPGLTIDLHPRTRLGHPLPDLLVEVLHLFRVIPAFRCAVDELLEELPKPLACASVGKQRLIAYRALNHSRRRTCRRSCRHRIQSVESLLHRLEGPLDGCRPQSHRRRVTQDLRKEAQLIDVEMA